VVVDDDRMQLRAIERVLRDQRHVELTVADNAIDAMLAVGALKPDLVIMDVIMPGLDGIEACRRIKSNPATSDVQVVLASAMMTPELERAARLAGAKRAVAKPVDLFELLGGLTTVEAPVLAQPEAAPLVRGADVLVQILADAGVEIVFGLPGGAISPVHDALLDSRIRMITTRHESGAMFAAAGYARATGKLAVVAVTSGPGVLNAMTGLATASCDGLPVLLLVGEVPRVMQGKGVLQDGSAHGLRIVEMARHITKLAAEVPRSSALPHVLRRAITTATSGRPGPAVLTLPFDVTTGHIVRPRESGTVTARSRVAPEVLDDVTALLRDAQRPLLMVGSGMRGGAAPARLLALAEHLSCPVATSPKGKGVFPESHPLALGVLGLAGHRSAQRYVEGGLDVVVALGTSLGDLATDGFPAHLQASRALIHVDVDPHQIGKSYAPTHAIIAPAAEFLAGLLERVADLPCRKSTLRAMTGGVERQVLSASRRPERMASHDAVIELQDALPPDTIFAIDCGEHFMFAVHFLEIDRPDAFVTMSGLGSMGQSIGAAIGTQLAFPGRMVAAICGDGCFAMNAFEVATAVAERLPIRVFVFNDERLGMVENGHRTLFGRSPEFPTAPLDVCAVARGLGATALRVERPGQLAQAGDFLRNEPGPVVIEVRVDPDIRLPRRERVVAMAATASPSPRPATEQ
jgi:acetolactate synthase-1/2/3 large subunit